MKLAERRDALLDAAFAVAADEGVHSITTRSVTARAGMPHGAFHYCFHTKNDLFAAMLARDLSRYVQALDVLPRPDESPRSAVLRLLSMIWTAITSNRQEQAAQLELALLAAHEPDLAEVAERNHARYLDEVELLLARFASSRDLQWTSPLRHLARMVLGMLDGLTLEWATFQSTEDAQSVLAVFARTLDAHLDPESPQDRGLSFSGS